MTTPEYAWYAVDVKKKAKNNINQKLDEATVEKIMAAMGNFKFSPIKETLIGTKDDGDELMVRAEVLANLQQSSEPGWWEDTSQHVKGHLEQRWVLIQQWKKKNKDDKRPWRMIIRVESNSGANENWSDATYDSFTTKEVVEMSLTLCGGPQSAPDNDDLPVSLVAPGFAKMDELAKREKELEEEKSQLKSTQDELAKREKELEEEKSQHKSTQASTAFAVKKNEDVASFSGKM